MCLCPPLGHLDWLGCVDIVSQYTEEVMDEAAVSVFSSALPLICAFWNCSQHCLRDLHRFKND